MWCEKNKIFFYFWKHNQFNLLIKTSILKPQIKHWKEGQFAILNIIYKYSIMTKSNYSNRYKKIYYFFWK